MNWYPGKSDEVSKVMIIVAVLGLAFLCMVMTLAEIDGGGDSYYYQPTAAPANQIYIDIETDGGCIGCVWNR